MDGTRPHRTNPLLRASLKRPNILITGTPGTGKTTTARYIAVRKGARKTMGERMPREATTGVETAAHLTGRRLRMKGWNKLVDVQGS